MNYAPMIHYGERILIVMYVLRSEVRKRSRGGRAQAKFRHPRRSRIVRILTELLLHMRCIVAYNLCLRYFSSLTWRRGSMIRT